MRGHPCISYLVILSNSKPRNQFLHIEKKQQKFFKISKQNKNIDIYSDIANQSNYLTNLTIVKLIWYLFLI